MGRRSRYSRSRSRRRRSEYRKTSRSRKRSRRSRKSSTNWEWRRSSDRSDRRRRRDRSRSRQRESSRTRSPYKLRKSSTRKRSRTPKSRKSRSPKRSPNSQTTTWKSSHTQEIANERKKVISPVPRRNKREYSNSSSPNSTPETPPPVIELTQSLDEKVQVHSMNAVVVATQQEVAEEQEVAEVTENLIVVPPSICKVPLESVGKVDEPSLTEKAPVPFTMNELFQADPSLREVLSNEPSQQAYPIKFNIRRRKGFSPKMSRGASRENQSTSILYRNLVSEEMVKSSSEEGEIHQTVNSSVADVPTEENIVPFTNHFQPSVRLDLGAISHSILPDSSTSPLKQNLSPLKQNVSPLKQQGLPLGKQSEAKQETLEKIVPTSVSTLEETDAQTEAQKPDIVEKMSVETLADNHQAKVHSVNESHSNLQEVVCNDETESLDNIAKASTPQPTLEKLPERTLEIENKYSNRDVESNKACTPKPMSKNPPNVCFGPVKEDLQKDKKTGYESLKAIEQVNQSQLRTPVEETRSSHKRALKPEKTQKRNDPSVRPKKKHKYSSSHSESHDAYKSRSTRTKSKKPKSSSRDHVHKKSTRRKEKHTIITNSSVSRKKKLAEPNVKKPRIHKPSRSKLPPKDEPTFRKPRILKPLRSNLPPKNEPTQKIPPIPKTSTSKLPPKNKPWCERSRREKLVPLKANRILRYGLSLELPEEPRKKSVRITRRRVIKQSPRRIVGPLEGRVLTLQRQKVEAKRNRIVTLDQSRSVFVETEDLSSIKITLKNRSPHIKVL